MARTRTEARPTGAAEAQLHVALDNMPGALVYTDDDLDEEIEKKRRKG